MCILCGSFFDCVIFLTGVVASNAFGADNIAATSSNLYNPNGLWVDSLGNLYVADMSNYRIRFVSASTGEGVCAWVYVPSVRPYDILIV